MNQKTAQRLVATFGALALAASVAHAGAEKPMLAAVPAKDLKWQADPDSPDVMMAVIAGDPKTGPWEGMVKFKAGISMPLHHHTADVTGVVTQGTMVLSFDGKPAVEYAPGSYVTIPAGTKHTTACKAGADCIVYERDSGKSETVMAEAPAKK